MKIRKIAPCFFLYRGAIFHVATCIFLSSLIKFQISVISPKSSNKYKLKIPHIHNFISFLILFWFFLFQIILASKTCYRLMFCYILHVDVVALNHMTICKSGMLKMLSYICIFRTPCFQTSYFSIPENLFESR